MDNNYRSGAHTKHRILIHFVFRPKYRKRVLKIALKRRLKELFTQCCEVNGWEIQELNIKEDHVHMLIQINPKDCISKVMQYIKGGSAKVIREEFPELEEFLWGDSFWSDGYFAESFGKFSETTIKRYIQEQNKQEERNHGL
jgi:putative transposase